MRCKDFTLLTPSSSSPVPYSEWKKYFSKENMSETLELIENAHALHFWNHLSSSTKIRTDERVPLTIIAERYCPRTFKNCGPIF